MDIAYIAAKRYTTKAFDPEKKIDSTLLQQIKTLLRLTPSSINSQPWHFIIAGSDEAKALVARSTTGPYSANEAKVLNASHVVVLCANNGWSDAHMQQVVDQEERDGRFNSSEAKERTHAGRNFYVNMHKELGDSQQWMEKQIYIALGALLLGAAALDIDACPIEGFDRATLDEALGLTAKGLSAVVVAALGYRSADDFNASLPKSRLPEEAVLTSL